MGKLGRPLSFSKSCTSWELMVHYGTSPHVSMIFFLVLGNFHVMKNRGGQNKRSEPFKSQWLSVHWSEGPLFTWWTSCHWWLLQKRNSLRNSWHRILHPFVRPVWAAWRVLWNLTEAPRSNWRWWVEKLRENGFLRFVGCAMKDIQMKPLGP